MNKLAIIIPAYKIEYFSKVLNSLANQTCKDFTVYIGIDASEHDFITIIKLYDLEFNIVYHYFPENFGGKDLVAQWERCIDLVRDEEWLWLFSDDDIMDNFCVQNFYSALSLNPFIDLFHFNVFQINEYHEIIDTYYPFPDLLTIPDFIKFRLQGSLNSFVVEYIFRKSAFFDNGRFHNFDLAWGSDDALWIKLGNEKGIKTIDKSNVYWRKSPFNISPNFSDKSIVLRKLSSQIYFSNWLFLEVKNNSVQFPIQKLTILLENWLLLSIRSRLSLVPIHLIFSLLSKSFSSYESNNYIIFKVIPLFLYKFKISLKSIFKRVTFKLNNYL